MLQLSDKKIKKKRKIKNLWEIKDKKTLESSKDKYNELRKRYRLSEKGQFVVLRVPKYGKEHYFLIARWSPTWWFQKYIKIDWWYSLVSWNECENRENRVRNYCKCIVISIPSGKVEDFIENISQIMNDKPFEALYIGIFDHD